MLFPEEALMDVALLQLREEIIQSRPVPKAPLSCDRWIARSALQKLIRRNEPDLALRALANLYEHDRRSVWRHLVIIATEDVGVANIEILVRLIAAYRSRSWREAVGGDWPVMCELVRQMAESNHCQATCDLLLRVQNDPTLEAAKLAALEANLSQLADQCSDLSQPLINRGIAALAMGGCLAEGQQYRDPCGVFEVMAETCHIGQVAATCHAAWKISRNPMTFLLPSVWLSWITGQECLIRDDELSAVQIIGDIPDFALDQFTRKGNEVNRAYLAADAELRQLLETAGIAKTHWVQTLGDALFLTEGGLARGRVVWPEAEMHRYPQRWLLSVATLGPHLPAILRHCQAKASQITVARRRHYLQK